MSTPFNSGNIQPTTVRKKEQQHQLQDLVAMKELRSQRERERERERRSRSKKNGYYLMVAFLISAVSFLVGMNLNMATGSIVPYQQLDDSPRPRIVHQQTTKSGKRIGILSIHVAGSAKGKKNTATVKSEHFPHILNKACYSHLWGYDYFFKTSWSYDPSIRNESSFALGDKTRCWLDIGNWHRVPVLKAMLSSGRYDWVVWTDADMVFNDLAVPIETLLKDFELHNKTNVHVVHATHEATRQKKIPRPMIFSSFGLMIRNSEYGHRVLDNWLKFAMGLCPNGNHPYECNGKYEFANSDQVGLWYGTCTPNVWNGSTTEISSSISQMTHGCHLLFFPFLSLFKSSFAEDVFRTPETRHPVRSQVLQ